MKRFMIATALTLAAASSALAAGTATDLPANLQYEIRALVPGAELTGLTMAQIARLSVLFSKSENLRSGEDPAGQIRAILASNT